MYTIKKTFSFLIFLFLFLLSSLTTAFAQQTFIPPKEEDDEHFSVTQPEAHITNFSLNPITDAPETKNKPNLIVIVTDDQPPNMLGIDNKHPIKTPNIDKLAREGTYLTNFYVVTGQCQPSRATLWTGLMPHAHGVLGNGISLSEEQTTIAEVLKANFYQTAFVGKCMLNDPQNPDPYIRNEGFDHRIVTWPDAGRTDNWNDYDILRNGQKEHHTEYHTDFLTTEAIRYIEQANTNSASPFFLWLSFYAPHEPTTPPPGSNEYTLDDTIWPPVSLSDNLTSKPPQQFDSKTHSLYFAQAGPENIRKTLRDLYEVMTNIDTNVGRITETLNRLNIRENTIIVFLSDNGLFYGEHQMFQKGPTIYEEQTRVPFIVNWPQGKLSTGNNNALTSSIDFFPTILDLLNFSIPNGIQGKSFKNVLFGNQTHRESIFFEYNNYQGMNVPIRAVKYNNYKWTHYLAGSYPEQNKTYDGEDFELYDLTQDPFEMNNLMQRQAESHSLERLLQDPQYKNIVKRLRKEMAEWQTTTNDSFKQQINNLNVTTINDQLIITWDTPISTTTEVDFRPFSCFTCEYQEISDLNYTTTHSVTIPNTVDSGSYDLRIYSIGRNGNGGFVRNFNFDNYKNKEMKEILTHYSKPLTNMTENMQKLNSYFIGQLLSRPNN